MKFQSTKILEGYSTTFRQWKAKSHCKYLHGYALKFKVIFEGDLDERGWVVDFGSFKKIKQKMKDLFDHTTILALDDPRLWDFQNLEYHDLIQLRTMEAVGCEKFAEVVFNMIKSEFKNQDRIKVVSVECFENNTNSAIYTI
jgi:6-pyruvoyltetrahydropterin/6-carboxytetrahydropterin synthase|tara:strand:+ start:2373 stop:2798 length:426 start_codon:yes stop_codon:yes gene_type:complete